MVSLAKPSRDCVVLFVVDAIFSCVSLVNSLTYIIHGKYESKRCAVVIKKAI